MVVTYLRSGKSPKEVAFILTHHHRIKCSQWSIFKIMSANRDIRAVYIENLKERNEPIRLRAVG